MLTFNHFITEKLLKGADTAQGYTEIWINPTREELRKISPNENLAAYVTSKNFYVWDRDIAEHGAIKWYLPENDMPRAPIYLDYYPDTHHVDVRLSLWSSGGSYQKYKKLLANLNQHPAFKIFNHIKISDD